VIVRSTPTPSTTRLKATAMGRQRETVDDALDRASVWITLLVRDRT
jgi:hypothetical protein